MYFRKNGSVDFTVSVLIQYLDHAFGGCRNSRAENDIAIKVHRHLIIADINRYINFSFYGVVNARFHCTSRCYVSVLRY